MTDDVLLLGAGHTGPAKPRAGTTPSPVGEDGDPTTVMVLGKGMGVMTVEVSGKKMV